MQATKAIETLLGKPGERGTALKLERVKARWRHSIDLDPTSVFGLAGQTYIDYYYALFGLRGKAAHGLGMLSLRLSRVAAVQAQAFAWTILAQYFQKRCINLPEAWQRLKFSGTLRKKTEVVSITKLTRPR